MVGSSSVANARTLQIYDGPDTSASTSAESVARPSPPADADWTRVIGRSEHPIRLSLDAPNSQAVAPRRPIRTTLDDLPEPPAKAVPPLPSAEATVEPPLSPAPDANAAAATTGPSDAPFQTRRLRLSLDQGERGAIGVPSVARPIRLQLDAGHPLPVAPRPYRSVLE